MSTKLVNTLNTAEKEINASDDIKMLENVKIKYLGKKGFFVSETTKIRYLPIQDRPFFGSLINKAKKKIYTLINIRKKKLELLKIQHLLDTERIDVSLPGRRIKKGNLHPISYNINIIESFFNNMGFSIVTGSEIEDEKHNFDYLNISKYHPSRTNNDTFWLNNQCLLRTQTSSVQIREMKKSKPPIKIITSGRVYRNDYDNLHTPMFNQIEGFVIDKQISFSHLKSIITNFLNKFFEEKNIKTRFRPSYFPFTEPSAEVDIMNENGKWLEVLGCGMIHPQILTNVNIDSKIYSGFAFGIGVERLISLRYNIVDLRHLFENDLRFLKQFK